MPDPQIRYARADDGVNIAYWTMGSGPPLVVIDLPTSNVQHELSEPAIRAGYDATARVATVVRYDHRGFGLSDKWDREFTTAEFVADLQAVADKLDLPPFFLIASRGPTYPIALAYAAAHPERVLRVAAMLGEPPEDFIPAIIDAPGADWRFVTEAIARRIAGWDDEAAARQLAEHMRQSADEGGHRRFIRWFAAAARPVGTEGIQTPCLFLPMTVADDDWIGHARQLASSMPDAAVQPIVGATNDERTARMRDAITSFFTQGQPARPPRLPSQQAPQPASGTAVILFTDIVDSTALTERLGDARFREASRALDERLRAAIREGGGTPIDGKVLGDGVMASFTSAREAIAVALRCVEVSAESELGLHIGLHAGDVIHEPGNVYGGTVNIASRICGLCAPGEVLVSDVVRGMARSSAGVSFVDRGEHGMKGVGDPVHVYAVVAAG